MWNNIRNIVSIPDTNINIKKEKKKLIKSKLAKLLEKFLVIIIYYSSIDNIINWMLLKYIVQKFYFYK